MRHFKLEDLFHCAVILLLAFLLAACGVVPEGPADTALAPGETPYYVGYWDNQSVTGSCPGGNPAIEVSGYSILGGTFLVNSIDDIHLMLMAPTPIAFTLANNQLIGAHGYSFTWQKVDDENIDVTYFAGCVGHFKKR